MHKDFLLIGAKAAKLGVAMPATVAAASVTATEDSSGREEDFSAVVRAVEQMTDANAIPSTNRFQLGAECPY
jgi:hypothetical protein